MQRCLPEDRARHLIDEILTNDNSSLVCSKIRKYSKHLFWHCVDVAFISTQIAFELQFSKDEIKEIATGAVVHDVGKILIPKSIVNKPDKLSKDEFEIIKMHPVYGFDVAKDYAFSDVVMDIIRHHHEAENGTGYPDGSTDMSLETQIVSIADKYDALTSKRSYKEQFDKDKTLLVMEMFKKSYSKADVIYDALYRCNGI